MLSQTPQSNTRSSKWKYWAFISYSHRDRRPDWLSWWRRLRGRKDPSWGQWLAHRIEKYPVPRSLVGKPGRIGPIPSRIPRVFRDEDELPASAQLDVAIDSALRESQQLVVICSPHGATSRYVNQEVLLFKRLGRQDSIQALIIDGEPNAADKPELGLPECFPPGLQFHIDEQGHTTTERREPIAADVRDRRDEQRALVKIVAGILGVDFDDLYQRHLRARRQRQVTAVAFGAFLLVTIGLIVAYALFMKDFAESQQSEARTQHSLATAAVEFADQLRSLDDDVQKTHATYVLPEELELMRTKVKQLAASAKRTRERFAKSEIPIDELLNAELSLLLEEAALARILGDSQLRITNLKSALETAKQLKDSVQRRYEIGQVMLQDVQKSLNNYQQVTLAFERAQQSQLAVTADAPQLRNRVEGLRETRVLSAKELHAEFEYQYRVALAMDEAGRIDGWSLLRIAIDYYLSGASVELSEGRLADAERMLDKAAQYNTALENSAWFNVDRPGGDVEEEWEKRETEIRLRILELRRRVRDQMIRGVEPKAGPIPFDAPVPKNQAQPK